ncbi:MAG: peptidyl-prolyl cis-trans isomerase, partial [Okeania sp. SIO2D1]|nr:peptidyl-prolyl cis-trans isomerase [Okeania sp. SIO2D1]
LTDDRATEGKMSPMRIAEMPNSLKTLLQDTKPGEIIGPLNLDGRYCLFRLEELLPVSLEGQLKKELQNKLFNQWMQEKMQNLEVTLAI